jgi:D-aspartate ligase
MTDVDVSLRRLSPDRPPAVVLGDLTLIRPHGMAGIPVIVATPDASDVALHSRYVQGSCVLPGLCAAHRDRSAEVLMKLGARLHQALGRKVPLAYGSDKHLELLYRHRSALAEHYLFVLNDDALCWSLLDKERFYALCAAEGIRAPWTLSSDEDDPSALAGFRGPILVKPRRKAAWAEIQRDLFGGRGKARVFPTGEALLGHPAFARLRPDLIVQEHIVAGTGDLLSFHGFSDASGRLLASFCGRKVRTYPAFAGESALIEILESADVDAAGRDIAARLGLRGPFKIDLIRDARSGALYTLEINARYTLWHYLGAVHGVNLPAVAYELLAHGRRSEAQRPCAPRVRWINLYREYRAYLERRADGGVDLGTWLAPIRGSRLVFELFAWDDPLPFVWRAGGLIAGRVAHGALWNRLGHSR